MREDPLGWKGSGDAPTENHSGAAFVNAAGAAFCRRCLAG